MAVKGWYKVYRSLFDGTDCVMIITRSKNRKTGPRTLQVWYLGADMPPITAKRCGADVAVCGRCPLKKVCYVAMRAPQSVWRAWWRGVYTELPDVAALGTIPESWCGLNLRFGSYGDPLSAPIALYRHAVRLFRPERTQAFTHAWRWRGATAAAWKGHAMASVEDPLTAVVAATEGWRTFRVRRGGALFPWESRCANEAAGILCQDCGRCGPGGGPRCPVISVHGASKGAAAPIMDLVPSDSTCAALLLSGEVV